jgi:hypothetical protein
MDEQIISDLFDEAFKQDEPNIQRKPKSKGRKNKTKIKKFDKKHWKRLQAWQKKPMDEKQKESDGKSRGLLQNALANGSPHKAQEVEEIGKEALSQITNSAKKIADALIDILKSKMTTKSSIVSMLLGIKQSRPEDFEAPTRTQPTKNTSQPPLGER